MIIYKSVFLDDVPVWLESVEKILLLSEYGLRLFLKRIVQPTFVEMLT